MVPVETKRYKILNSLPVYGPMYIPVAEDGRRFYSEGFPVRFYKTDKSEWVANFALGWTDLNEVRELKASQNLLVIAGGNCYLMSPEQTLPVSVFGGDYVKVFENSNGQLVLQGSTNLTIVEVNGEHWHSERISWDGLKNLEIEGSLVTGVATDPMDDDCLIAFAYNIDNQFLTGGSYNSSSVSTVSGEKPWWKFWH